MDLVWQKSNERGLALEMTSDLTQANSRSWPKNNSNTQWPGLFQVTFIHVGKPVSILHSKTHVMTQQYCLHFAVDETEGQRS